MKNKIPLFLVRLITSIQTSRVRDALLGKRLTFVQAAFCPWNLPKEISCGQMKNHFIERHNIITTLFS